MQELEVACLVQGCSPSNYLSNTIAMGSGASVPTPQLHGLAGPLRLVHLLGLLGLAHLLGLYCSVDRLTCSSFAIMRLQAGQSRVVTHTHTHTHQGRLQRKHSCVHRQQGNCRQPFLTCGCQRWGAFDSCRSNSRQVVLKGLQGF
jgi:hypothetical protein